MFTFSAKVSFSPTSNNAPSSSRESASRAGQGSQSEKNGPSKVNNSQSVSTIGSLLSISKPQTQTLRELLATTPGFSMKVHSRKTCFKIAVKILVNIVQESDISGNPNFGQE